MKKIGIYFGTDSGTTRLIAKKIAKKLGDEVADKPVNVNRTSLDDLLEHDAIIMGTPTYGEGQLPGVDTGVKDGSWVEFLPKLSELNLSGKKIALYGLGNQEKYAARFADSLFLLYEALTKAGAKVVGEWGVDGYTFEKSLAVKDGKFVGLVLDHVNQALLTDQRIDSWLEKVVPELTAA